MSIGWASRVSHEPVMSWCTTSFGRSHAKLLPGKLPPGTHDTDRDIEQSVAQTNCGQRSLAWLVVFDKLGPAAARLV